jgi:hypothetical protein
MVIDRESITADCARGFGFLANLTDDECWRTISISASGLWRTDCAQRGLTVRL